MLRFLLLLVLSAGPFLGLLFYLPEDGALPVLASVSGFLGGVFMLWQFLLGIRQVTDLFSFDYSEQKSLHIQLGIYGMALLLVHPVLEMLLYLRGIEFIFLPDFSTTFGLFVFFGQLALFGSIILWITSALFRKKLPYLLWRTIHYISYPVTFLAFIHVLTIGTYFEFFPLIKGWWIFLFGIFLLATLWRVFSPLFTERVYVLTKKEELYPHVFSYTFRPKHRALFPPMIGQYLFLRKGLLEQAHPFTILRYQKKTQTIELGIKSFGKFTASLEQLPVGSEIRLDGPYGSFTQEAQNTQPKVLISGGIGITPFLAIAEEYPENTYLLQCVRSQKQAFFRDILKRMLGKRYKEIISNETPTDSTGIAGRLSKEILQDQIPVSYFEQASFFLCGPPGLMEAGKRYLRELNVSEDRIFTENFG